MAKASIIIPVYNKEKYLKETLQSVDKQIVNDLEVMIIDDKSTDHGMDIIRDFQSSTKKQVRVIQNDKNKGVAYSRNIGVEESKSQYIAFLDADDLLDKNFMNIMLAKANRYPGADYIYGLHVPFKETVRSREIHLASNCFPHYEEDKLINPSLDYDYIRRSNVSCNARLYKKSSIQNLKFVESHFEDYEFFLDTLATQLKCIYTTQPVYGYRITTSGKYKTSILDIKTCIDYFDIFDHIEEKYPNMDDGIHKWITKRQIYICERYLHDMLSRVSLTSKDLITFSNDYSHYLNLRYGYCGEEFAVLERVQEPFTNPEILKENIRKIAMKY